jgi:cell division protein FtsZ
VHFLKISFDPRFNPRFYTNQFSEIKSHYGKNEAITVQAANIRVIGLGGAGNNAVNRMIDSGLDGVEFIAANTDAQVLANSHAELRLQIGDRTTRGLGAGANPEVGEKSALEDRDQIKEHLEGADMVFITAGMGGGTGTGSAPVVAEIAKEIGALTIGIVTRPFKFEGPKRLRVAEEGIKKLSERVDGMIIVNNEKLVSVVDRKAPIRDAFLLADRVLYYGVKGISDVINASGLINVDFADVKMHLTGAGSVLMGIGAGRGDKLVEEAVATAIHSPLLERGIEGAKKLLINITGTEERVTLADAYEIVGKIQAATGLDENSVDTLFGVAFDEHAGDEIRVTVVATGFNEAPGLMNQLRTTNNTLGNLGNIINSGRFSEQELDIPAFLRYRDKDS